MKNYNFFLPFVLALTLTSCGPSAPVTPPPVAVEVAPQSDTPSTADSAPAAVPEKKPEPTKVVPPTAKAAPKSVAPAPEPTKTEPAPAPEPAVLAPVEPAAPPPAPDLRLEPASALQAGPVLVKTAALPPGTVVRYTVDGSDPAAGKVFPSAGLSVAQSGLLRVWAAQPGGEASLAEAPVTIGEIWVQPGASGDGSWQHPVSTPEDAIAKASALGIRRLKLTSGQWNVKLEISGTLEISGGWKSPGEPSAASVLIGSKQSGATQKEPAFTLKALPGSKLTLSGVDVRAPNSSFASALEVKETATVDTSRTRLAGGNGLYGYGVHAAAGSVVTIADSTLYGGDGGSSFALSSEKATIRAVRSTFDAGTGDAVSYGLNVTLTKLTLVSSVVWGGAANSSYGVGLYSSDNCIIQGSTILGGKGASAWALYISESEPEIVGCLIGAAGTAKSYGIFANYGRSLPKALRANGFFGAATGAFVGADLGAVSAEPDANGAFLDSSGKPFNGQKGNVRAQPNLGPAPDYKTLATSPATLLKGGEPLTGDAALDRGGKARGATPAIGAWVISP